MPVMTYGAESLGMAVASPKKLKIDQRKVEIALLAVSLQGPY